MPASPRDAPGRRGALRLLAVVPLLVSAPGPTTSPSQAALAIVDVRVLAMDGSAPRDRAAVLVVGDRIRWVGPAAELELPAGARRLDGRGRTVMPGLADMHVHLSRADLEIYLAHGITTVRNMWGFPDVWAMRAEIARGEIAGPTIHTVSPGLDGTPPKWPLTQIVMDPKEADAEVEEQWQAGYRTIKVYQDLRPEAYDSIVASARRRGMAIAGHVPHRVGLPRALAAGQRSVEHLTGYVEALTLVGGRGPGAWTRIRTERIPGLAADTRAAGAWVCPTLAIVDRLALRLTAADRESSASNRRTMVRALHDAGAGLLVGTDAGIDVVDPGASLLDELEAFVAAGIPRLDALRIATAGAAAFLREEGEFGVIAPGARADLLVLDGDPSADLRALETPVGVLVRGRWFRDPDTAGSAEAGLSSPGASPPARASAGGAESRR